MRHRIPQFGHIFQAMDMLQVITAIYGLMWLARMRTRLLPKETDLMTKKSRKALRKVFSVGNTTDQEDAYRSFRDVTPRVMLSWEQEVLIPLKRRIKIIETVFSLIKERFEFQIALLYIISWLGLS
jgi:hypothetical protein